MEAKDIVAARGKVKRKHPRIVRSPLSRGVRPSLARTRPIWLNHPPLLNPASGPAPLNIAQPLTTAKEDAFVDYRRTLTADGGILITYKDYDLRWRHTIWRVFAWLAATGFEVWLVVHHSPVASWWINAACLLLAAATNWLIVMKKVQTYGSVEIRPDGMIVDGGDVFWLRLIESNWPTFKADEKDKDEHILCGIYGNRFVEYTTSHRLDELDRTPEILATHLHDAMVKLWSDNTPEKRGPSTPLRRDGVRRVY
jgi:hypothetical protein